MEKKKQKKSSLSSAGDMNRAFFLKKEDRAPRWRLIDAHGKILGRLATEIATALTGKDKAIYTKHTDAGDYVVVINAQEVVVTGDKEEQKIYAHYTGYMGGLKERLFKDVMKKDPAFIIEHAVKGMLAKNKLNRKVIRKLKVYPTAEHPHIAQVETSR